MCQNNEPIHSSAVLVSDINRAFVKQWIEKYAAERAKKVLMLLGPVGCGKSTLALLCLRESRYTIVRIDASMYRGRLMLLQILKDAQRLALKQAIFVEDPEIMSSDGGLQILSNFSKQGSRIPVIIICGKAKKPKMQSIIPACELVIFRAMPASTVSERFGFDPLKCTGGDLRAIWNRKVSGFTSLCDQHLDLQEAAMRLLGGENVQSGLHIYRLDTQVLGNIVHSNYVHLVKTLECACQVSEDLSYADILASHNSDETASDIAGIMGTVQPGLRIQKAPASLHPDVVWTKMAFRLARCRSLSASKAAFEAAGTILSHDSLPLLRSKLLSLALSGNCKEVMKWAPTADSQQIINVLRGGFVKNDSAISRVRRNLKKLEASACVCI